MHAALLKFEINFGAVNIAFISKIISVFSIYKHDLTLVSSILLFISSYRPQAIKMIYFKRETTTIFLMITFLCR